MNADLIWKLLRNWIISKMLFNWNWEWIYDTFPVILCDNDELFSNLFIKYSWEFNATDTQIRIFFIKHWIWQRYHFQEASRLCVLYQNRGNFEISLRLFWIYLRFVYWSKHELKVLRHYIDTVWRGHFRNLSIRRELHQTSPEFIVKCVW